MKTVRRLFYADIVSAVAFVGAAFLSLFFFIDFIDQLGSVGQGAYTVLHAALYCLLLALMANNTLRVVDLAIFLLT